MQKTYTVDVEEVGAFTVSRRNMRAEIAISSEFNRLTDGQDNLSDSLSTFAMMVATVKVLVLEAPEGWSVDDMDPFEPSSYLRVTRVFRAIREREEFFRNGSAQGSAQPGQGTATARGMAIPETVEPASD